jgi:hypothetical protein
MSTRPAKLDPNGIPVVNCNWDALVIDSKTCAVPGAPEQFPSVTVPDGVTVLLEAPTTNTNTVYVAGSSDNALLTGKRKALAAGDSLSLRISNLNVLWINSVVAAEGVEYTFEQDASV